MKDSFVGIVRNHPTKVSNQTMTYIFEVYSADNGVLLHVSDLIEDYKLPLTNK